MNCFQKKSVKEQLRGNNLFPLEDESHIISLIIDLRFCTYYGVSYEGTQWFRGMSDKYANSPQKASNVEFLSFLIVTRGTCWKAVELQVIWDALVLTWRYFNNKYCNEKKQKVTLASYPYLIEL